VTAKAQYWPRVRKIQMWHRMLMAPRTTSYAGHLAPHLDLIIDGHRRGLSIRDIAEALYAAGARAETSDPGQLRQLSQAHHVVNLAAMVAYVLTRCGLRKRRSRRQLTARPRAAEDGTVVWEA
jgi:hypothetical protein